MSTTLPTPKSKIELIYDCLLPGYNTVRLSDTVEVPTMLLEEKNETTLGNMLKKHVQKSPKLKGTFWYTIGKLTTPETPLTESSFTISAVGYNDIGTGIINREFCMYATDIPSYIVQTKIVPIVKSLATEEVWNDPVEQFKAVKSFLFELKKRMIKLKCTGNNTYSTQCFVMTCGKFVYCITKTGQRLSNFMTIEEFEKQATI